MLQEIYINNFVLIDELRIEFNDGLNVLTGETGAGKSIIIDALGLIMGERIKNDFVRDESRKAVAEAVFDIADNKKARLFLQENGLIDEEDNSLIVCREISPQGRSTARINGRNVNVAVLKELSSYLLDMHLQHDHLDILRPEMYLDYVDSFIPAGKEILKQVGELYNLYKIKVEELNRIRAEEKDKAQRMDFLAFQIEEIEQAHLKPGEEEEITALVNRIRNARNLAEAADRMLGLLYSTDEGQSAYDQISAAIDTANGVRNDEFMMTLITPLEEMYYSLQDIAGDIARFRDSLDFEPGLLDELENRLHEIHKLQKKYGEDINEILEFLEKCKREWEILDASEEKKEGLEKEISRLKDKYTGLALQLTDLRKQGAAILEEKVNTELLQLCMPHIKFAIAIEPKDSFSPSGMDVVDFMFSPNPGEEMRSLSKIASGGEISRFILALKKALAEAYHVPTLIFDEIDVGVGGTALSAMAQKISELSRHHQVILVTHSPQVASYAKTHYLIEKHVKAGKTFTSLTKLDYNSKIKELARMLGGENYSEITLKHAGEMLDKAILK